MASCTEPRPRISIVTPSLNQGAYIEECIRSVKDQLGSGDEHIVVDGGSNDGTVAILGRYPHIRWISEPDKGQADALNKGFRMASGEIIGWLNSDDAYLGHCLNTIRAFFEKNPRVAMTYGYVYVVDAESRPIRKRFSPDFDFGLLVRRGECYAQPTFFLRRSILASVGYLDPAHRYGMDYDLILRLGRHGMVKKLPKCLGMFRMHRGSISHSGEDHPQMREIARSIQAQYRPFVSARWPSLVYRIHDAAIFAYFKALGRVVSLPMYLRYRLLSRSQAR